MRLERECHVLWKRDTASYTWFLLFFAMKYLNEKFEKNICSRRHFKVSKKKKLEVYSKHNLKKKIVKKLKNFFLLVFLVKTFFKFFFKIVSLMFITDIFFIKIDSAVFEKNYFSDFAFLIHNSYKNVILRLIFAGVFSHINANLWCQYKLDTRGGNFHMLIPLDPFPNLSGTVNDGDFF